MSGSRWQRFKESLAKVPGVVPLHRWYVRRSARRQVQELRQVIRFLLDDASQTRRLLRHLVAEHPHYRRQIEQTAGSFDFQWDQLPEGNWLLTNTEFAADAPDVVCQYTGLPASWFHGKRVLDAGCGAGRFSWAMAKMGAHVTAVDLSTHGLASLARVAARDGLDITTLRHNLLEPLPVAGPFDLVWSFGVLHHTGDTYRGFQNLLPLVPVNGLLFLMLYGEPRDTVPNDYVELNHYERLRRLTCNKPLGDKIEILRNDSVVNDVHGWFDAISPAINDIYSFDEIEGWLVAAGFGDVRRTVENRNHHVIARRQKAVVREQLAA